MPACGVASLLRRLPTLGRMGGEWLCSFSRRSMELEELLGSQPSAEAAKQMAEQHAQAHQCQPVGPWIQVERA